MQALRRVVLFDGECATCNRALSFIARHLPDGVELSFVPLRTPLAEAMLAGTHCDRSRDALVYLDERELLQGAAAVKRILALMPRWRVLGRLLDAMPDSITESAYDLIAANRHRFSSNRKDCPVPGPRLAARLVSQ